MKILRDGKFLDREAIQKAFAKTKINATVLRLALLVIHAGLDGIICSGPLNKSQEQAVNNAVKRYRTYIEP